MAKCLIFLVVLFCTSVLALGVSHKPFKFTESDLETDAKLLALFDRWSDHHDIYHHHTEKQSRFNVFKYNANYVHTFNKRNRSYKLGLNKFSALTNYEFRNMYASSKISHYRALQGITRQDGHIFRHQDVKDVPKEVDWRKSNAVTAVKDQGQCGSCWAFSAVATVESLRNICGWDLVSYSEQQLVDCDKKDNGCNGGLMDNAFTYIKNNGISTEKLYPYKGNQSKCPDITNNSFDIGVTGIVDIAGGNEDALLNAVVSHPVAVAINADGVNFQHYSEGVFEGECSMELDHGVTIVGYGEEGTKPYWIVKNSWGAGWGMNGYIKIKRGVNQCGIAQQASYPTIRGCAVPSSLRDEL